MSKFNDAFPTDEEKELSAKLRAEFSDVYEQRLNNGTLHSCLFGDLALTRVLRANGGELELAIKWFKRCLAFVERYDVDTLVAEMSALLDGAGGSHEDLPRLLPDYEKVASAITFKLCSPKLTPEGDLSVFLAYGKFDKRYVYDDIDFDAWARSLRQLSVMLLILLERMSRAQGRLVCLYVLADVMGASMDGFGHGPYDTEAKSSIHDVTEALCAEILGEIHILNATWRMKALHRVLHMLHPELKKWKVAVHSGDMLADDQIVRLVGGREELEAMYHFSESLPTHDREDMRRADCLATEREKGILAQIREDFKEEFSRRAAEGRDYPFFFGDIALTRVLRGNDGSYRSASKWLRTFLDTLEEEKVDAYLLERREAWSTPEQRAALMDSEFLPGFSRFDSLSQAMVFSAPDRDAHGNLVHYALSSGLMMAQFLESETLWADFRRWCIEITVQRCIQLDELSRQEGRLVKCHTILDFAVLPPVAFSSSPVGRKFIDEVQPVMGKLSAEHVSKLQWIHVPWVMARSNQLLNMVLPRKLADKIIMWSSRALKDSAFQEEVGGSRNVQLLRAKHESYCAAVAGKMQDADDGMEGEETIPARRGFVRSFVLHRGQRAKWSFETVAGMVDGLLGASDVEFKVDFTPVPAEAGPEGPAEEEPDAVEVVAPRMVQRSTGHVEGEYVAAIDGLIELTWSNCHSAFRRKSIHYTIAITDDETPEQAPE